MMVRNIAILGIVIALMGGVVWSAREAQSGHKCPCGVSAAFVKATGITLTAFVEVWIGKVYILLAQNFAATERQVAANNTSLQEIGNHQAQVYTNVIRERQALLSNNRASQPPSAGLSLTAAAVFPAAEQMVEETREELQRINNEWLRNNTAETAAGTSGNAAAVMNNMLALYCTEEQEELGICQAVSEAIQGAATEAETILENTTLGGDFKNAGIHFCRNLAGLPPSRTPVQDILSVSQAEQVTDRLSADARYSVALDLCSALIADRAEIQDPAMAQWVDDMIAAATGGNAGAAAARPEGTEGTSHYEMLKTLSEFRFSSAAWVEHITTTENPVAVLKEIMAIRAASQYLSWQRYELQKRMGTAMATIQGTSADMLFREESLRER